MNKARNLVSRTIARVITAILIISVQWAVANDIVLSETDFSWSIPQWTSASPNTFTVTISSNAPIASAPFWFSPQHDWLQVTPGSGTLNNDVPSTITLQPHVAHLDPGTYTNIITFVSPYIDVSPLFIEAVVTIEPNPAVQRGLRLASGVDGAAGHVLTIPIQLISTGDVNAVGFSLEFNRNVFANPVVEAIYSNNAPQLVVNASGARNGRMGIMLGLEPFPVPHGFTEGTQTLLQVTFELNDRAVPGFFPVTFADSVVLRQFASTASETTVLPGAWASTRVLVHGGYEAGVPENRARNYVPSPDIGAEEWMRVGRLVAGLDSVRNPADFQAADCAPMATRGDGVLSLADWVQAGIYYVTTPVTNVVMAAGPSATVPGVVFPALQLTADLICGLPPSQTTPLAASAAIHLCTDLDIAGDTMPSTPVPRREASGDDAINAASTLITTSTRRLNVMAGSYERGRIIEVPICFNALGTENSIHFTLDFDPELLEWHRIRRGDSVTNAILLSNQERTDEGHIGAALALQPGARFPAGEHTIAYVEFYARAGTASEWARIRLSDEILPRKVLSDSIATLQTTYSDAYILLEPTATSELPLLELHATTTGNCARLAWNATSGRRYAIYRSTNLVTGSFRKIAGNIQSDGGMILFEDPESMAGGLYIYRIVIE